MTKYICSDAALYYTGMSLFTFIKVANCGLGFDVFYSLHTSALIVFSLVLYKFLNYNYKYNKIIVYIFN